MHDHDPAASRNKPNHIQPRQIWRGPHPRTNDPSRAIVLNVLLPHIEMGFEDSLTWAYREADLRGSRWEFVRSP